MNTDKIVPEDTEASIEDILNRHDTDKNGAFHNYGRQYTDLFRKYRHKPIRILEIGVHNGHSLRALRDIFPHAVCIVGLDILSKCKVHENSTENIFVEIGNATERNFLQNIVTKYGSFDIIIDDGSHVNRDVIKSFYCLFPLMNDNGLYIVEDTICYKLRGYIDAKYLNHLKYFFTFTKFLNQCRLDSHTGVKDLCVDPFKIQKKTSNAFEYSIDKIEYGCSYVAIHKKVRTHWIPESTSHD